MVYGKKKTGVRRPKYQAHDNKCSCILLLKGSTPFSVMPPTTLFGKLFHTWTAVWMNVRPVETVPDTGTAKAVTSGNRFRHWYCKSMTWHWHTGAGGSSDNVRLRKQTVKVYRAFTGVHFVEDGNCCHLTSLVEGWDVQYYPSLIHIHTNNSKCLLLDRVQQSKCCWAGTHTWKWCVFHYTPHLGLVDNCSTSSIQLVYYSP